MVIATRISALSARVAAEFNRFTTLSGLALTATDHGASAGTRVPDNASTDQAIRALTPQLDQDWGAAFPASPYPGQQFYRTDLQDRFFWDDARSKWLGELQSIEVSEPNDNDRVHFGRVEISNLGADGAVLPYDAVIVEAHGHVRQSETMTLSYFLDSVTALTVDWANSMDASTGPLNIDWNQGQLLNAIVTSISTGTFNRMYGKIAYRRRAT